MKFHAVLRVVGFTGQLEKDIDVDTEDEAFACIAEQTGQMKENDCDIMITLNGDSSVQDACPTNGHQKAFRKWVMDHWCQPRDTHEMLMLECAWHAGVRWSRGS